MNSPPSDPAPFERVAAYDRFMGRYSDPLADEFARAVEVAPGERVLDVGCGSGALTQALAKIVGAGSVGAADPSVPFVEACRARVVGADVRIAPAEALPFPDDSVDRALAQLVFHFVADPAAAAAEMIRVTRPGGTVAACVWDFTGGMTMLRTYWDAALEVDEDAPDEIERFGGRPGQLAGLWRTAGLDRVAEGLLTVSACYRDFDELWETCLDGAGPVGAHVSSLDGPRCEAVREAFHRRLGAPAGELTLIAQAWYATAVV
jgi:SAM-dependent methyltransferase